MKYVVVTGGSVSGLGKGTCVSSLGITLKAQGFNVTAIKIDPYLNVDAGTMSPCEHGEVFVLEDGHEGDLDLGNYERALEVSLTRDHNVTTGKIYQSVIESERRGDYLGSTVQVVPHVTNRIQDWIERVARVDVDGSGKVPDMCLIEVGGTVGDIESSIYLEALQQFFCKLDRKDYCLAHLTFLPTLGEEQKTKPAQHSFRFLREAGLQPDFVLVRCDRPVAAPTREKLSMFSQVPPHRIISVHNVTSTYLIPEIFAEQNVGLEIMKLLDISPPATGPDAHRIHHSRVWRGMAERLAANEQSEVPHVSVAIVGKYLGNNDTYLSIVKALEHSSCEARIRVDIVWIDSEELEPGHLKHDEAWAKLKAASSILIPGGFGHRGVDGKMLATQYARENRVPFLGICYGMQLMVIEACRSILGLKDANSEEIDPEVEHKAIVYMPETINKAYGGTMRLGDRCTIIEDPDCLAFRLYDRTPVIHERHRHRYEVNIDYVPELQRHGFQFSGKDDRAQRMEILELPSHPFYFGVQYHPEFTSKVCRPNPCFLGLVLAAHGSLSERLEKYGQRLCSGINYSESDDAAALGSVLPGGRQGSPETRFAVGGASKGKTFGAPVMPTTASEASAVATQTDSDDLISDSRAEALASALLKGVHGTAVEGLEQQENVMPTNRWQ